MGYTFTIEIWVLGDNGYEYQEYWAGSSFIKAMFQMIKAHREGHGCVTLHWR